MSYPITKEALYKRGFQDDELERNFLYLKVDNHSVVVYFSEANVIEKVKIFLWDELAVSIIYEFCHYKINDLTELENVLDRLFAYKCVEAMAANYLKNE